MISKTYVVPALVNSMLANTTEDTEQQNITALWNTTVDSMKRKTQNKTLNGEVINSNDCDWQVSLRRFKYRNDDDPLSAEYKLTNRFQKLHSPA